MRVRLSLIIAVVLAACAGSSTIDAKSGSKSSSHSHHKGKGPSQSGEKGEFDYYLMALSWSPSFCETHPDAEEQCQHKGYGFVLHGLWPQYDAGGGPENCATTDEVDKQDDRARARLHAEPLADRSRMAHAWRLQRHGTRRLFRTRRSRVRGVARAARAQRARKACRDDARTRCAPRSSRPIRDLTDDMMSLHCSRGELVEVRVCLDKNVTLHACGKRTQTRCPATATITLPASR